MDARTLMAGHSTQAASADLETDSRSDADLVQEVGRGSEDALATLYDRYVGGVHATALRIGGDPSLAAEVVQDTFLGLWNRAERYDPARGSLAAWLQTIARNRTIDRLRATGRRGPTTTFSSLEAGSLDPEAMGDWLTASAELVAAGEREATPEAALAASEQQAAIREALAALRPTDRTAILLAYQSGLSQSEIAAHLNWPLGTVKTRTRRALQELRSHIERSERDDRPAESKRPLEPHPCWQTPGRLGAAAVAVPCA
jgi:RNA polymerase sigma-70 factor, ECF subfamily